MIIQRERVIGTTSEKATELIRILKTVTKKSTLSLRKKMDKSMNKTCRMLKNTTRQNKPRRRRG